MLADCPAMNPDRWIGRPGGPRPELRALRPASEITPNGNDPAPAPGTVGPETYTPGDPSGFVVAADPAPSSAGSIIVPSPWSGWPSTWDTPPWNSHRLEELADVAWSCIDLNAGILAAMPAYLVGADPGARYDWLENPDPDRYTSWVEFAKELLWDFQLGEAFVLATARYDDELGLPARFHVVPPYLVTPELGAGGLRRYFIGREDVTGDLLHVRYKSRTHDAHGHGPLEASRFRLVAARVLLRYATDLVSGGAVPPGVLETDQELDSAQADDLLGRWVVSRMQRMGLPAVMSSGLKWRTTAVDPEQLGLLDLAKHAESRIAVACGVPPWLVGLPSGGDSLTYNTVSGTLDFHWRAHLRPRTRLVLPALSGWLTGPTTRLEVNADAYVQPGPVERAGMWQTLIAAGVLTAEQVQQIERYNESIGPDTHLGMLTL
jgi:phage portal protein BeeE